MYRKDNACTHTHTHTHTHKVYRCSVEEMVEDLEKGDVAETAKTFFLESTHMPPCSTSTLTLGQVR